jgi:hypothetical protein
MDSIFFKRLSLLVRRRRRRLKAPLLPSQNALGGISYSSLFFLLGKKSPKVGTQSLFWSKFPFSKTSPQILGLGGETDWLLFERSYTKTDTK